MILQGKIKDSKMCSFSYEFQTLIKNYFPFTKLCIFLRIIDEFEKLLYFTLTPTFLK